MGVQSCLTPDDRVEKQRSAVHFPMDRREQRHATELRPWGRSYFGAHADHKTFMDLRTGTPVWLASDPAELAFPKLRKNISCDVAIIGAGVTGALLAHALLKSGLRVVVLDKREVGRREHRGEYGPVALSNRHLVVGTHSPARKGNG